MGNTRDRIWRRMKMVFQVDSWLTLWTKCPNRPVKLQSFFTPVITLYRLLMDSVNMERGGPINCNKTVAMLRCMEPPVTVCMVVPCLPKNLGTNLCGDKYHTTSHTTPACSRAAVGASNVNTLTVALKVDTVRVWKKQSITTTTYSTGSFKTWDDVLSNDKASCTTKYFFDDVQHGM